MSKTSVILVVSLALNVFLLVLFAAPLKSSRALTEGPPASGRVTPKSAISAEPEPESSSVSIAASASLEGRPGRGADAGWAQVLRGHVADLRRRGVGEAMIKSLAAAEAQRLFRERVRELLRDARTPEYWEPFWDGYRPRFFDEAKLNEFQRLRREKQAVMRQLFGEGYADAAATDSASTFARVDYPQFDYLPADKRLALMEYLERANLEVATNPLTPIRSRLGDNPFADSKRDAEIRLILGPELFDEYVKRSSNSALQLRQDLATFRPSRAEFDSILAIERDFAARSGTVGRFADPAALTKFQAAGEQKLEAIRGALGDSRYADYERASDWGFRQLDQLAREMQLDPDVARSSYSHVEQARAKVAALAKGRALSDPNVQGAATAIQRELATRLAEDLGLQDLSEAEQQMLLQPVTNVWPQGGTRARIFRP